MFSPTLTQISYADHPVNRATDDQHSLTMQEIIKKLDSYDVSADRIIIDRFGKDITLIPVDENHRSRQSCLSNAE